MIWYCTITKTDQCILVPCTPPPPPLPASNHTRGPPTIRAESHLWQEPCPLSAFISLSNPQGGGLKPPLLSHIRASLRPLLANRSIHLL